MVGIVLATLSSTAVGIRGFSQADLSIAAASDDAGVTVSDISGPTTESGGFARFTVVLASKPTADVAIALSSSNTKEGTVDPAELTFSPDTWNTPQTVTVTGVDDGVEAGDATFTIITDATVSKDPAYDGLKVADVVVVNSERDIAGVAVSVMSGFTSEGGDTATFTIALTSPPTNSVTIELVSDNHAEGVAEPASLTFSLDEWNKAQTVTVTGVDDAVVDGPVVYAIRTDATSKDPNYDGIAVVDVSATNLDNDSAAIAVSAISGPTSEAGGTATFTVALTSQPAATVSLAMASTDTTEGTVAPSVVTFTSGNWNTPQTVTITGVDDSLDDGNVAFSITTAAATSSDPNYNGFNPGDVAMTNIDDDAVGTTVSAISAPATEAGGIATFTVVLNSQPTADVMLDLSSSDLTEGTVAPSSVTFTVANWSMPRTVTVTGVDDPVADGNVAYMIVTGPTTSADSAYNGLAVADVPISTTDDDVVGVTVTPTTGLTTTEFGGVATFTMMLTSQPSADVAIAISTSQFHEGVATPATVTFTTSNWTAAQTVTVTGVDDTIADGSRAYLIATAPAISADASYSGVNAADVGVTNIDNDTPGITLSQLTSLITSERGTTATFTVVLNTQPAAAVVIGLSSSDTTEAIVGPSSLRFTASTWNLPQTVTLMGVNDSLIDGSQSFTVITAAAVSPDQQYDGLDPANVNGANLDDDVAGIAVTPTSGLVTAEGGGHASFAVALNTQPAAQVVIGLASSRASEGEVSTAALTFTPANWNIAQTVIVTGIDDALPDGAQQFKIVSALAISTDQSYHGIDPVDVIVTNLDDDVAAIHVVTAASETTESGGAITFALVLGAQPIADVTIPLASSDSGEGIVSRTAVTFTRDNWDVPVDIDVTGVDDGEVDGNTVYTVVTGPAVSRDPVYSGINPPDVTVRSVDDGRRPTAADPVALSMTPAAGPEPEPTTLTPPTQPPPSPSPTIWIPSQGTSFAVPGAPTESSLPVPGINGPGPPPARLFTGADLSTSVDPPALETGPATPDPRPAEPADPDSARPRLPVLRGVASRETTEGTPLVMTSATRNAISVSSPGGVPDLVEMTLTVSHGTLALVGVDGLRLREGGLGAAARMTFVGGDVDLTTALDGLTFFPEAQFVGTADVCVGVRYASKSAVDQRLCDESSLPAANGLSDERSSMSTGFTIRVRPQPVAVVQPKPGDSGTRK